MQLVALELFAGYDTAIAVVGLMLTVAGMIFGIGYAINDKKITQIGRDEIYQCIINGMIIGALFIAFGQFGIITLIINSITSGISQLSCSSSLSYNSAICFAYDYLAGSTSVTVNGNTYPSLITSTISILTPAALLYTVIGTLSTVNFDAIVITIGLAGLNFFLAPLQGIIDFLTVNLFVIMAQAALLKLISLTAIPIILPLGLILRSFYFTRALGGTLIAIAIAFFAVFPLTYVLDAQIVDAYSTGSISQLTNTASASLTNETTSASGIENSAFSTWKGIIDINANTIFSNPLSAVNSGLDLFASTFTTMMTALEDIIAFFIIQVFILPAFSIVLTLVSARELARALGAEIYMPRFDLF